MEEFNFEKLIKEIRTYKPAYGMSAGDYICSEFCKSIIKMLMNLEVKAGRVNFYKFDRRKAKLRKIRENWKSHTNLTHPGKYFRPSKVKIMRPTSPK